MEELIKKVERWSEVRNLHTADPKAQTLKVVEEFTEMLMAVRGRKVALGIQNLVGHECSKERLESINDDIIDGVGDTYVTLIILCQQLGIDFVGMRGKSEFYYDFLAVHALNDLATGISKSNMELIEDAADYILGIADEFAENLHTTPKDCLQVAYDEIKDRKGMMIEGTFVKYEDLSKEQQDALDKQ